MIIKEKSFYKRFTDWFKGKYGYELWDRKFEGEEGKWSIGEMLFITIPLAIIYIIFDEEINSIFDNLKNTIMTYFS
mgnify:CR=1 FL=1|jgi:hypothetical protein